MKPEIDNSPIDLPECTLCPRNCRVRRSGGDFGYCRAGMDFNIAAICTHRGEEPVLSGKSGICNIFFTHCNLQCIFCQNHQISRNDISHAEYRRELKQVIEEVEKILERGVTAVGFVSPSHCIRQMTEIIHFLRQRGRKPIFVMNTNAYDKSETLKTLEEEIEVFLPDFKYMDSELAEEYSGAGDYPEVAKEALKEIFRQKGAKIEVGADGTITSGLIVRHLVLPGEVANSKACLRFIAGELSPAVYISLMAQYHPTPAVSNHPRLGRTVNQKEYDEVREEMERLGFQNGWVQEPESAGHYLPDFHRPGIFPE